MSCLAGFNIFLGELKTSYKLPQSHKPKTTVHMRKFLSLLAVLALFVISAIPHARKVSGVISDLPGAPVPFASITLKGTCTSVSAHPEGKFFIDAATGQTLVIRVAGFKTMEEVNGDFARDIQSLNAI